MTQPQTKYLKDYKAPAFAIENVHLTFDLRDGTTTVRAKTRFIKKDKTAKDLVLDGQEMELHAIALDGQMPSFEKDKNHLTIHNVPDHFTLEIVTEIHPEKNTALEGLYRSSGNYCTQCEAEGFRKITYYLDRPDVMTKFTTRIEADKTSCPVLLSNGNCIERGDLGQGRHYAVWEDPFAKPCYLFALVAGDLAHVHDTFTTMHGRKVDLYIYVNHGNADKCAHAMESLKKSMRWDEEKYGREYDLDIFNIVAVNDFNMGAMENKSLNIFNSKLVLAKPETATDGDYFNIESVIGHEYFHNWSGNRVTCRDWFQLSLKEGLTVFRDQCFSADVNDAHDACRIDDVNQLRAAQFAEDASPLSHPVRPDSYIEINNFYTTTVYEKGAEVIRMMHTLLGEKTYRKATDLYFQRFDGQAVTCDDFAKCMEEASGIDLTQFKLWYSQAGTPEVKAKGAYDADKKTFTLTLTQNLPGKKPMHMPIRVGLLGSNRKDIVKERVLELKEPQQAFTFEHVNEEPVPSILRGFSAPVKLTTDLTDDNLLFLMSHDTDGFNRWEAGQTYLQRLILSKPESVPGGLYSAFHALITDKESDPALIAKALTLPSENYLAQLSTPVDPDALHDACHLVTKSIGTQYLSDLEKLYHHNTDKGPYKITPAAVGKRRLKNTALHYIAAADHDLGVSLAAAQYKTAHNMTDKVVALAVLADTKTQERDDAFNDFYETWKADPLVLDKWFSLQATANRNDTHTTVAALLGHPDFTYKNPNRVRALLGSFASGNPKWFHRPDGAGYKLLADTIITLNAINPQIAARLLTPFRNWKRFEPGRKALMEAELKRILSLKDISNDVYEIASKSLG